MVIWVPVVSKVQTCQAQLVQTGHVPAITQQPMVRLLLGLLRSVSLLHGILVHMVMNVHTVSNFHKTDIYSAQSPIFSTFH